MDIVIVIAKVIKISLLTFMDMTIIRQSFSFFYRNNGSDSSLLLTFPHQVTGEYSGGTLHLGGAGTLLVVFGGAW